MQLSPIDPTNLRQRVAQMLRSRIITGDIQYGVVHSATAVAAELGVSATPVREALFDLASDGLVELVRNKGFRVPELTSGELDELLELRLMLEVPCVQRLIGRMNPTELDECRALAVVTEQYARDGDLPGFLESDRRFHRQLLVPLGTDRILDLVCKYRDLARLYGLNSLKGTQALISSAQEHRSLVEAIAIGDGKLARGIIEGHLRHTRGIWAGVHSFDEPMVMG